MRLGGAFILITVAGLLGALAVAERRRRARASRAEVRP
jgi:hypothetical protein